jgi:hypothetical protein
LLPYYAELDDARRETMVTISGDTANTAVGPNSGNPPLETDPVDVVMTINTDNDPLAGASPDDPDTALVPPIAETGSLTNEPSVLP